jgi:peptidoglycan/LPS O-acetylase OafA/YrhL
MNPASPGTGYLSNLTPLRGIAALFTVIFHVDLFAGNGGNLLLRFKDSMLISKMYLMVDFFFILSGFIMFYVYGKWFKDSIQFVSFKQFSIARFARVYPLHFFTLLFLILLRLWYLRTGAPDDPFSESSFTWISIPTNLLLIQSMNIHNWFSWNNAAWSISTEWWMYMLFPFLVKPFSKLKKFGRSGVVLICIAGYLFIMFYLQRFVTVPPALGFIKSGPVVTTLDVAYQFGFLRCLFGFSIGMITYLCYKDGLAKDFLGKGSTFLMLSLGLFTSMHFALWDVLSVSFFPLLILSAAYGSKRMNAFFGRKALQRIGDWSYSIYLVHQPMMFTIFSVLTYLNPPKPGQPPAQPTMLAGWIICIVFIGLTLLVSSVTYRFVEVPARKWINRRFTSTHSPAHPKPILS